MPTRDSRAGLASRDFALLLIATFGVFTSYAPLLSVAPMWVTHGGAASGAAGAATGVTMAATVAAQLCVPRLHRRLGFRTILAAGALVLGAPAFGYALSASAGWVLAVCAVRGLGFGLVTVAGSALVAELVPAAGQGRAVGWYGMAVGLPQVLFLPLGVWAARHVGFTVVFTAAGAAGVVAAPLTMAIRPGRAAPRPVPGPSPGADGYAPRGPVSPAGAARHRDLAPPWLLMITVGCALGGITAFVPLRFGASAAAPASLFLMSAAVVAGRWAAGSWSDRAGGRHLLVSGVTGCALGLAGLAAAVFGVTALILPGAALYGLGLGAVQNDTLVIMFRRAGPGGHGAASTAWNIAVDAGTGIGATAIGWGSDLLGLGGAFAVCAALIAALTPVALRIRARERPPRDAHDVQDARGAPDPRDSQDLRDTRDTRDTRHAARLPAGDPAVCGNRQRGSFSETE